jgi:hypothetical protein
LLADLATRSAFGLPGVSASRGDVLSVSSRQVLRHPPGGGCWRCRADDRKCPGAGAAVRRTELAGRAPFQASLLVIAGDASRWLRRAREPARHARQLQPAAGTRVQERRFPQLQAPARYLLAGLATDIQPTSTGNERSPGGGGVLSVRSERSRGHPPAGRCCPRGARATMAGWRSLFPSMPSTPPSAGSGWLPVPDLRRVAGMTGSFALPAGSVCCGPSMR